MKQILNISIFVRSDLFEQVKSEILKPDFAELVFALRFKKFRLCEVLTQPDEETKTLTLAMESDDAGETLTPEDVTCEAIFTRLIPIARDMEDIVLFPTKMIELLCQKKD